MTALYQPLVRVHLHAAEGELRVAHHRCVEGQQSRRRPKRGIMNNGRRRAASCYYPPSISKLQSQSELHEARCGQSIQVLAELRRVF